MLGFVFSVCDENSIISQQTKWAEFSCAFLIGMLPVLVASEWVYWELVS